ncbi:hypothetical protein PInf_000527 [Phytophthora infestans]|nr:hypothetical protein PInf_000527 [Phytophthora infestans]
MATPTSRRSSISSVTSSGRRRMDQSLAEIASSLGQRTPDRSQGSDDSVSARSRQLDFGSVDDGNVDEEQIEQDNAGSTEANEEVQEVQEEQEEVEEHNQAQETVATARPRPRRGRRGTVFWSAEEEEFLRRGVEKYGIGKWKKILIDGNDVFSSHRTNVDLKDKWKNMCRIPSRKRRRKPDTASEPEEEREPREIRETASSEHSSSRPRRFAAAKTKTRTTKKLINADADQARQVKLKLSTDKSSPEFAEVNVDLDTCKDVAALKAKLRSSILSDASPDRDIQLIGLKSRVLFDDKEELSRCIATNGADFFLVFEENPEEFV